MISPKTNNKGVGGVRADAGNGVRRQTARKASGEKITVSNRTE
jgi:hypothetical protein